MSRHTTSLRRLAKLAVLIPLELALRVLARLVDRDGGDAWTREKDAP